MLGTSEDVVVIADEVIERDGAEESGGTERDVRRDRKVAFLLEIVGRRRPGRAVRLKLRQLAQEPARGQRGARRDRRAVGGVGGPGTPLRQVYGAEADLQLLPWQNLHPRRPGESTVGLDPDRVAAGQQRP